VEVWAGEKDEAAFMRFAEKHALKGPAQRLLAALSSTGSD
jgi:hypothetical protein